LGKKKQIFGAEMNPAKRYKCLSDIIKNKFTKIAVDARKKAALGERGRIR